MTAYTPARPAFGPNPLAFPILGAALVALAFAILLTGKMAIYGLFGLMAFLVFVQFPVVGLYATTALLLLSGSENIIALVNESAPVALTLSRLCGTAALLAWLLNVLLLKVRLEINWPVMLISFFCGWALLSALLSGQFAMVGPEWFRLVTLLGFFLLAVNVLNTPARLHLYIVLLILSGLVMAFVAVAQHLFPQYQIAGAQPWAAVEGLGTHAGAFIDQESLQGDAAIRVSGRAGHSNWLALIILLLLPLNSYWYAIAKNNWHKLFILFITGIEILTLVYTYTRTGLVIGATLGILLLLKKLVRMTPLRLFAFLTAIVIGWVLLPGAYKERVLNPKQYVGSKSVQSRVELQEAAWRYTTENPILGLGPGGFGTEFIRERNDTAATMKLMVDRQDWNALFIGTHNMFLELSANMGVIGLIVFMWFFILMLRKLYLAEQRYEAEGDKQGAALASALFVSLIGFLVAAVFLHALMQKIWWMVAAAAVVIPLYQMRFQNGTGTAASGNGAGHAR